MPRSFISLIDTQRIHVLVDTNLKDYAIYNNENAIIIIIIIIPWNRLPNDILLPSALAEQHT